MKCNCNSQISNNLIVEADFTDPIWCGKCRANFEIEEFDLSINLLDSFSSWSENYGEWIDWDTDKRLPNADELISKFNKEGLRLTEQLRDELGESYTITFSPSK
ncbi:hypothetical protein [Viridibacillus arvi]|uniref:Uncharacterized protein n=1 Tax=Viridibacillus arvi TaxID=263475 RepID=A0A0M0LC83_9BACL|nr:hypothetical protein [Viridibacillus arvi]KOO48689.1 hypothetical protein AMD00_09615 [Viridibacillus arvi]